MENIIELILGNIFFIFIALWILSSLFGRKKQAEQQEDAGDAYPVEPQRPRPQPQRQQQPWERVDAERDNRPEVVRHEAEPVAQPSRTSTVRQEWELSAAQKKALETDSMENAVSAFEIGGNEEGQLISVSAPVNRLSRQEAQKLIDFSRMSHKSVVEGYVWSEIFGKSRAKNPHRMYQKYGRMPRK